MKFSPVRNNDRRGRNVRSRYVSDFEMNGADYAPQPNDAKKESFNSSPCVLSRLYKQVGLANILETIVDTLRLKEEDAPDYFDIVKRPMDLSTIRDKVRKIEYRNHEQFRHDVWQIQLNAHLYNNNGRNPGIPPLADQLLEICDCLLEDYGDQLAEAEKVSLELIET
ncbi:LOW QUALITY PROTEIN: hypothetical protein HID58_069893 [Brassica napus]|uniref:Bromo domain-containing protein n=1 Tax=Brassica napus TaxID=3708 RepID=A0ABQ7YX84_BRANA|nr:LOW QUALITY PROTEIN: hypothetical protein HID58_069893 [Brassica napus]